MSIKIPSLENLDSITYFAVGSVITFLLTIAGFYFKTKFERKSEFKKEIGKRMAEAMKSVRDIANKLNMIEIYNLDEIGKVSSFDMTYYPSVLMDVDTLNEFFGEIAETRRNQDQYLSDKVAAHLFVLERYIMELYPVAKGYVHNNTLPELGIALFDDFKRWSATLEKLTVNDMNSGTYKISSHAGRKWEKEKTTAYEKMYNGSSLQKMKDSDEETLYEDR